MSRPATAGAQRRKRGDTPQLAIASARAASSSSRRSTQPMVGGSRSARHRSPSHKVNPDAASAPVVGSNNGQDAISVLTHECEVLRNYVRQRLANGTVASAGNTAPVAIAVDCPRHPVVTVRLNIDTAVLETEAFAECRKPANRMLLEGIQRDPFISNVIGKAFLAATQAEPAASLSLVQFKQFVLDAKMIEAGVSLNAIGILFNNVTKPVALMSEASFALAVAFLAPMLSRTRYGDAGDEGHRSGVTAPAADLAALRELCDGTHLLGRYVATFLPPPFDPEVQWFDDDLATEAVFHEYAASIEQTWLLLAHKLPSMSLPSQPTGVGPSNAFPSFGEEWPSEIDPRFFEFGLHFDRVLPLTEAVRFVSSMSLPNVGLAEVVRAVKAASYLYPLHPLKLGGVPGAAATVLAGTSSPPGSGPPAAERRVGPGGGGHPSPRTLAAAASPKTTAHRPIASGRAPRGLALNTAHDPHSGWTGTNQPSNPSVVNGGKRPTEGPSMTIAQLRRTVNSRGEVALLEPEFVSLLARLAVIAFPPAVLPRRGSRRFSIPLTPGTPQCGGQEAAAFMPSPRHAQQSPQQRRTSNDPPTPTAQTEASGTLPYSFPLASSPALGSSGVSWSGVRKVVLGAKTMAAIRKANARTEEGRASERREALLAARGRPVGVSGSARILLEVPFADVFQSSTGARPVANAGAAATIPVIQRVYVLDGGASLPFDGVPFRGDSRSGALATASLSASGSFPTFGTSDTFGNEDGSGGPEDREVPWQQLPHFRQLEDRLGIRNRLGLGTRVLLAPGTGCVLSIHGSELDFRRGVFVLLATSAEGPSLPVLGLRCVTSGTGKAGRAPLPPWPALAGAVAESGGRLVREAVAVCKTDSTGVVRVLRYYHHLFRIRFSNGGRLWTPFRRGEVRALSSHPAVSPPQPTPAAMLVKPPPGAVPRHPQQRHSKASGPGDGDMSAATDVDSLAVEQPLPPTAVPALLATRLQKLFTRLCRGFGDALNPGWLTAPRWRAFCGLAFCVVDNDEARDNANDDDEKEKIVKAAASGTPHRNDICSVTRRQVWRAFATHATVCGRAPAEQTRDAVPFDGFLSAVLALMLSPAASSDSDALNLDDPATWWGPLTSLVATVAAGLDDAAATDAVFGARGSDQPLFSAARFPLSQTSHAPPKAPAMIVPPPPCSEHGSPLRVVVNEPVTAARHLGPRPPPPAQPPSRSEDTLATPMSTIPMAPLARCNSRPSSRHQHRPAQMCAPFPVATCDDASTTTQRWTALAATLRPAPVLAAVMWRGSFRVGVLRSEGGCVRLGPPAAAARAAGRRSFLQTGSVPADASKEYPHPYCSYEEEHSLFRAAVDGCLAPLLPWAATCRRLLAAGFHLSYSATTAPGEESRTLRRRGWELRRQSDGVAVGYLVNVSGQIGTLEWAPSTGQLVSPIASLTMYEMNHKEPEFAATCIDFLRSTTMEALRELLMESGLSLDGVFPV